jgi:hypothetical protein
MSTDKIPEDKPTAPREFGLSEGLGLWLRSGEKHEVDD